MGLIALSRCNCSCQDLQLTTFLAPKSAVTFLEMALAEASLVFINVGLAIKKKKIWPYFSMWDVVSNKGLNLPPALEDSLSHWITKEVGSCY